MGGFGGHDEFFKSDLSEREYKFDSTVGYDIVVNLLLLMLIVCEVIIVLYPYY